MSYLDQAQDPGRRATAIAVTLAVHALVGAAVVTGLTISGFVKLDDYNPTIDFPLPDPPEPTPEPTKQESQQSVVVVPTPPLRVVVDPPIVPTIDHSYQDALVIDPAPRIDPVVQPDPPRPAFTPRAARPSNSPTSWLSNDDYPARALRAEAEGVASYRLIVGTNGRVSACELTRSTGNAQLDAATCDLIQKRARFEAATDDAGAKVVGSFTGSVRWDIPD